MLLSGGSLALQQTGCGVQCVGVGCAEEYGASRVGVQFGAIVPRTGIQNPRRSDASIIGDLEAGVDWSVAVVTGRVFAGMPDPGEVRSYAVVAEDRLEHTDHEAMLASDMDADRFGALVMSMGDADGNGEVDVVITAPQRSPTELKREAGAVFLVPASMLDTGTRQLDTVSVRRITGPQAGARFGESVVTCPDMDGDGLPELLVGLPWYDDQINGSRTVYLAGAATLVLSSTYPQAGNSRSVEDAELWTGAHDGARVGTALACADVIGDDTPDIIIGAPYADGEHEGEGSIYIVNGSSRRTGDLSLIADRVLSGTLENGWLGWSITTGDLDGDGKAEIIGGSPGHTLSIGPEVDRPQGLALVWSGKDLQEGRNDTARFRITGVADGDGLGRAVATADLNNDGLDDLLLGAPRREVSEAYDAGALYVFPGHADDAGLRPQLETRDAEYWWEASRAYLQTGGIFATGDLNDDERLDLLLVHRRQPG